MGFRDLRDPRAVVKRVASMDAERLAAAVQEGGLGPVAEKAVMAELAGRVLADEVDDSARGRSQVGRVVDVVTVVVGAVVLVVWIARTLGLFM
jgi:uncharacterized membrane protein